VTLNLPFRPVLLLLISPAITVGSSAMTLTTSSEKKEGPSSLLNIIFQKTNGAFQKSKALQIKNRLGARGTDEYLFVFLYFFF